MKKQTIVTEAIIYTEEYWMNSPLSTARFFGGGTINGKEYIIVNKEGKDLYECSEEAVKDGRHKAIQPREPADLILLDWLPIYKALGRDKFIEYLKNNPGNLDEAKNYVKSLKK